MTKPVEKLAITDDQLLKILLLGQCRFFSGSPIKAFVRDMNAAEKEAEAHDKWVYISEAQAALLDKTYWHYRKQVQALSTGLRKPEFIDPATVAQDSKGTS